MDLDTSQRRDKSDQPFITSSPPPEASRELGDDSLFDDSLFFESNSPQQGGMVNKKRRSEEIEDAVLHDEQAADGARKSSGSRSRDSSLPKDLPRKSPRSSSPGSSPTNRAPVPAKRLFERFATTGASSGGSLFGKRNRPSINAVQPSDSKPTSAASVRSAYPGLYGPGSKRVPSTLTAQPPHRRSISAQIKPGHNAIIPDRMDGEETEEEDVSFDTHSPIAVYKRQGMTQRSASYTQGPMSALPGPSMMHKMLEATGRRYSEEEDDVAGDRSVPKNLPGCRDHESEGKILPCFAVKEDGIVRITPHTVSGQVKCCGRC